MRCRKSAIFLLSAGKPVRASMRFISISFASPRASLLPLLPLPPWPPPSPDMDTDTILVTDTDTILVTDTDIILVTDTDITLERGPLMLNPLLMPNPLLPLSPDMLMALMVLVMLTVMVILVMDTDTPTDTMVSTITAKDLLSPPLLPNPDTVITDTVTVTLTDTDTPMLMVTTVIVTVTAILMASKFILLSFLSNYYNGCVYKKFYDSENFDLRSTVPEVESLAY